MYYKEDFIDKYLNIKVEVNILDKKLIEETFKKIMALDEQTEKLKEKIVIDSKEKEQSFRKEFRGIETKFMEEIRIKSRNEYKKIISEANLEKMRILDESIEKSHDLEKLLEERKDELICKIFGELFKMKIG